VLLPADAQTPAAAQSMLDSGATAPVERRDLTARETVGGTLGYGEVTPVASTRSGTVTWLPREGDTVRRGQTLYRVDTEPVTLLYGRLPAYRDLPRAMRAPTCASSSATSTRSATTPTAG
jgi:multidrug efflux pump subunit AcrA (membrane-fusion protein)